MSIISVRFIISPFKPPKQETDKSLLEIDRDEFQRRFLENWGTANISASGVPVMWFEGSAEFFGGWFPDSQLVTFGAANLNTCVDFALWYRSFIDESFDLYLLSSEQGVNNLKLTPAIQRSIIEKFIFNDKAS